MSFCEILRSDHENIQKGRVPVMPARFTIEEIVGEVCLFRIIYMFLISVVDFVCEFV